MSNHVIPTEVAAAFERMPAQHRDALFKTRALILDIAATDPRIGELEETLRWGEPAYLTRKKKTGSTIRLGMEKNSGAPALFFNCNTSLVSDLRARCGDMLRYSKNRAVLIDGDGAQFRDALAIGIAAALTYHLSD